jgi:phage tail protein X
MTTYRTIDGDMVDAICKAHYGNENMLETVLEANPGLAALGPVLSRGQVITLPEKAVATTIQPVRLWS